MLVGNMVGDDKTEIFRRLLLRHGKDVKLHNLVVGVARGIVQQIIDDSVEGAKFEARFT